MQVDGRASKTHVGQLLVEDRNVGALSSWSTEVPLQEAVVTVTSVTGWAQWRHLAQCTPSHDNGVCAMSSGVGRWKNVLSPMLLLITFCMMKDFLQVSPGFVG